MDSRDGYTKHLCFLCYWDSRDKSQHWVKDVWPASNSLKTGNKNIIIESLVVPETIIFPPLHIKLELTKQFVKALDFYVDCFQHICYTFPGLGEQKLKGGIFNGLQLRQMIKDSSFVALMTSKGTRACKALTEVIKNFLGNKKAENYKDLLLSFELFKKPCKFPQNFGSISEEQVNDFIKILK